MPAVVTAARLLVVLLACTAAAHADYTQAALEDEIKDLPGLNYALKYRHFSGYIDIPGIKPNATKHVHYHFIESENDPTKDPVVWWTNGGPGCSGLIAAFTEMGPFKPNAEGVLVENAYRWNKVANMLFVEQPGMYGGGVWIGGLGLTPLFFSLFPLLPLFSRRRLLLQHGPHHRLRARRPPSSQGQLSVHPSVLREISSVPAQ